MKVPEKKIKKEMREHPWAGRRTARKIAHDHLKGAHTHKRSIPREITAQEILRKTFT